MSLREQLFDVIKSTKKNEPVNLKIFKGKGSKSVKLIENALQEYCQAGILYANRLKELFVNPNLNREILRVFRHIRLDYLPSEIIDTYKCIRIFTK